MPEVIYILLGELLTIVAIALSLALAVIIARRRRRHPRGRHSRVRHRSMPTVADLRTRERADRLRYYPATDHASTAGSVRSRRASL
jgi:hypothetical protein